MTGIPHSKVSIYIFQLSLVKCVFQQSIEIFKKTQDKQTGTFPWLDMRRRRYSSSFFLTLLPCTCGCFSWNVRFAIIIATVIAITIIITNLVLLIFIFTIKSLPSSSPLYHQLSLTLWLQPLPSLPSSSSVPSLPLLPSAASSLSSYHQHCHHQHSHNYHYCNHPFSLKPSPNIIATFIYKIHNHSKNEMWNRCSKKLCIALTWCFWCKNCDCRTSIILYSQCSNRNHSIVHHFCR